MTTKVHIFTAIPIKLVADKLIHLQKVFIQQIPPLQWTKPHNTIDKHLLIPYRCGILV